MNKSLLLTFVLFCCTGFLTAQTYTVQPIPVVTTASLQDDPNDPNTPNPGDVVGHAEVVNNSTANVNITWVRNELIMPDGWRTGICDINTCYGMEVNREAFMLSPGQKGTLDVHLYPGGMPGSLENGAIPGEGVILLSLSNSNVVDDTITARFEFTMTGNEIFAVSTTEIEFKDVNLFPNPTEDFFAISPADTDVKQVAVFNILGRQIKQFDASETRFDVSDLSHGVYLVSLLGAEQQVLKTMRLQKK